MDHTRHIDIYDLSRESITLIGAGGIGATTAIALAKMGVASLTVLDMDDVGTENLATQLHKLSDVGMSKVKAIGATISEYANDVWVETYKREVDRYNIQEFPSKFLICAVDNIKARQEAWAGVSGTKASFFIDARMSAEEFHLYVVDLKDTAAVERYDKMIWQENDEDVPDLPCTMKATIYTAFMAAGHICNAVKKLAMGEKHPFAVIHNIKTFTFLAG